MKAASQMKGLVVAEPWIDLILNGKKTWEMRSRHTNYRGVLALVRKGSGLVVGIAELVDCQPCRGEDAYRKNEKFHSVPRADQPSAAIKWPVAWVLKAVRPCDKPVRYMHKPGAQSQIILSECESKLVRQQCGASKTPSIREVRITQSALDNCYIPLTAAMDLFPKDAIGGSSKADAAIGKITANLVHRVPVCSDIDGSKKMLRARGTIKEFFSAVNAKVGDVIAIEKLDDHNFNLELRRR